MNQQPLTTSNFGKYKDIHQYLLLMKSLILNLLKMKIKEFGKHIAKQNCIYYNAARLKRCR